MVGLQKLILYELNNPSNPAGMRFVKRPNTRRCEYQRSPRI